MAVASLSPNNPLLSIKLSRHVHSVQNSCEQLVRFTTRNSFAENLAGAHEQAYRLLNLDLLQTFQNFRNDRETEEAR